MRAIKKIRQEFLWNASNIPGWTTSRQLIVIESDDWGTIRSHSKEALLDLKRKGYPVDKNPYCYYDALESNEDLQFLMEVLGSVKDKKDNPAVLTANNIVANPDFEKIRESGFTEYHYEIFPETLKRYPAHDHVMDYYREAIDKNIIQPQFHGREHVNVGRWLATLKDAKSFMHDAFAHYMFSMHTELMPHYFNQYMDSLDCDNIADIEFQKKFILEGASLFESIWGFRSTSFIAPCYIWHRTLEPSFHEAGIRYIQGLRLQYEPLLVEGCHYKTQLHFMGQRNSLNQRYLVRNAFFEPTPQPNIDWVSDCLHRISIAFRWKKPAIISTHRLNFIGFLEPQNRDRNLKLFSALLKRILKEWPMAEFISSDKLGAMMDS